ncbi:MAG: YggU family protein [Nitrospirales bacterium]|nr:YggU family protein [Nitrospirales bacterium]
MEIPHRTVKDGIILEVKVIPKSSHTGIAGVMDGTVVKVKLTAPPVEGAANEQLIAFLAEEFGIKKSSIVILKGETSRRKTVKLTGVAL